MVAASLPGSEARSYSFALKIDGFRIEGDTFDAASESERSESESESFSFTRLDACFIVLSIIFTVADLLSDVWVACEHFKRGNFWFCGFTVFLILVPSLIVTFFSARWYMSQLRRSEYDECRNRPRLAITLHVFQLAIVYRRLQSLRFGFRSRDKMRTRPERRVYYRTMLWEDNNAAVLCLIESFLESVPQLLLQVYHILTSNKSQSSYMVAVQWSSVAISLASVVWSVVSYMRTLRFSLDDSPNVSLEATIVCCLWRLLVLVPRLAALALFAAIFSWALFGVAFVHWLFMFTWLVCCLRIGHHDTCCTKLCFKATLAAIYIFCFVDMTPGDRYYRYLFFYVVMFFENTVLMGLGCYCAKPEDDSWILAVLGNSTIFGIGIIFLITYYRCLHPNAYSSIQSESSEIDIRNSFSDESHESSETPSTGRNSPQHVSLTNLKRDSPASGFEAGDPCSLPRFEDTAV